MRPALLVALAAAVLPGVAAADPLQDQLLARMRASRTDDVAFTMTTRAEQTGSAARQFVQRYDGRGGWTLQSVDGHPPTDKDRKNLAKRAPSPPRYAKLADWFGGPATRVAATPTQVTYRFTRLPAGTVKLGSHDASADTVADAVVDLSHGQPYVSRIRFTSTAPFRMMLVAKVERFTVTGSYAPLADGRIFSTGNDSEFVGSMLGKAGTLSTRTRYTDMGSPR